MKNFWSLFFLINLFYFRMSEIQRFHKILHHSAFRADPLSIIKQHVENTIEKKQVVDDKTDKSSMNVD